MIKSTYLALVKLLQEGSLSLILWRIDYRVEFFRRNSEFTKFIWLQYDIKKLTYIELSFLLQQFELFMNSFFLQSALISQISSNI